MILETAAESGGSVLIPAFAVGRSQEILWWLSQHRERFGLHRFRIFLDSPMAVAVGEVYERFVTLLDEEAKRRWQGPAHPLRLPNLRLVTRSEDSIAINRLEGPLIVIAGSGMCNGGRILHHLRHRLWRDNTAIVFVGYQAAGTLGRKLVEGASYVTIFGERIKVRARIHTLGGFPRMAIRKTSAAGTVPSRSIRRSGWCMARSTPARASPPRCVSASAPRCIGHGKARAFS